MGKYEADYNTQPDTAVPIGWLFEHRRPQVSSALSTSWHGAIRRAIEIARDTRGMALTHEVRDFADGVEGLNPNLHELSLFRFSRPDGGSISEDEALAMRRDVGAFYAEERAVYGSGPSRIPDGIAQLVVPPLMVPEEHGRLWYPEAADLRVFDWGS